MAPDAGEGKHGIRLEEICQPHQLLGQFRPLAVIE